MENLHNIQMLILRELLFKPNSRFTDLNIKDLTSDHFSYHIKKLQDLVLVEKTDNGYSLTTKGKEYANQMDTDYALIEKQPKVAVMLVGTKIEDGVKYLLIQERTKEPYFGYRGFITGKTRFGEKILQTAKRELEEETGLTTDDLTLKAIVRDHVRMEEDGKLVEDKIFFIIEAKNPTGKIMDTECGKNYWLTEDEFLNLDKLYYSEKDNYYKASLDEELDRYQEFNYEISEF